MQFKPQQQAAIDHLGNNVIVPASAGAGKTAVLIQRLMKRIMIDKVELDEICAMTFTEAAASEMKVRLMKALNQAFSDEPSEFITKQLSLLETADISTIHSFCLNIVKNYGYIIGVNPDETQNIMPPSELSILRDQAIKNVIDTFIETDFETARIFLDTFSSNPLNFSGLEEAVLAVADWIINNSHPEQEIEKLLQNYQATSLSELTLDFQNLLFKYYEDKISQLNVAYKDTYHQGLMALDEKPNPVSQEMLELLGQHGQEIARISNLIMQRNLDFYDLIEDALNTPLPQFRGHQGYKEASAPLETLTKEIMSKYQNSREVMTSLNDQYPLIKGLLDLSHQFLAEIKRMKKERKALDFSDFEPMALAILEAENGAVAKMMQSKYKEIMVDEFQDTNSYQDAIIRLISNGQNIFRVGDVKQAIYGFRGGKPQIMQEIIEKKESDILPISYNFRSKQDIVNFNNVTFENIMNLTLHTKYTESDIVETGIPNQNTESTKVEFHVIQTNEELEDETEIDYEDDTAIQQDPENKNETVRFVDKADTISAYYIANKISEMVSQEECNFRDITILVRAHHLKDQLKEAFDDFNIPYFLNEQSGFYRSAVVESSIYLLNYLVHKNDFYLTKVLMSPYYNFSLDMIAEIRSIDPYNHLDLASHYPSIYQELDTLRRKAKTSDIISLVQELTLLNNAYNTNFSIQDKTNMDALLEKAIEYSKNNAITVTGFITYLESLINEKSSEATPIASDEDVVTSMTIHQSKGLQFPVVFLFGLGKHHVMNQRNFLLTDDDLGISLNHIDLQYRYSYPTLLRTLMNYKQNHDAIEESMRLLYVALTRAESRMIIVDAVKEFTEDQQHAKLTEDLLFKHTRKIHLLIPASENTATVHLLRYDPESYKVFTNRKEQNSGSPFSLRAHLNIKPELTLPDENKELNLDRSHILAMEYGTLVHEAIESLPNSKWEEHHYSELDERIKHRLRDYNVHETTLDIYNTHHTFHHELPYLIKFEEDIHNGIMDFVAISDTQVTLVDFKTDNADEETIVSRYQSQIDGYKKALNVLYPGLRINTYIYSFSLKDYIAL